MNREQKSAVVEEIADQIQAAEAIFAVDYRGITVAQVADLRARLRESDARFRVVKNSLSERAADKAGMESLKPMLVGPTALTLVNGDAALAARALADAARTLQLLDFKGGVLNGSVLTADEVRSIARLPSREVLTAQLVGTIAAPLSGLVRTLNALIAGVAIQLQAIVDLDPPALVSGTPAGVGGTESGDAAEAAAEERAAAVEGDAPPEPPAVPVDPEPNTPEAEAETARAAGEPAPEAAAAAETESETDTQAAPDAPTSDA
jgi:large subunit ribosomal protein L10